MGLNTKFAMIQGLAALIMKKYPSLTVKQARSKASFSKQIKGSDHTPHYGVQAAARNLKHAKRGTHDLKIIGGHVEFA